jgi:KaiC/GvpD/RAD55 family RecA-like ATPase
MRWQISHPSYHVWGISHILIASFLIRFLRRSHDTHTAVLMRVPVGRRKKKKTRFTCCIWMSHYNMQMDDDEPKRARAENKKIKKKANNLLRR